MGMIKTIIKMKKISKGEKAKFTIAEISSGLINLRNAEKNLSKSEYNKVLDLYRELQKDNVKEYEVDINGYSVLCMSIIEEFGKIAPCGKYCN